MADSEAKILGQMKDIGRREFIVEQGEKTLSTVAEREQRVVDKERELDDKERELKNEEAAITSRETAIGTHETAVKEREYKVTLREATVATREGKLNRDTAELACRKSIITINDKANAAKVARFEEGFEVRKSNLEKAARATQREHEMKEKSLEQRFRELGKRELDTTVDQRLEGFMDKVESHGRKVNAEIEVAAQKATAISSPLEKARTAIQDLQIEVDNLTGSVTTAGQQVDTTVTAAQNVVSDSLRKSLDEAEDLNILVGTLEKAVKAVGNQMVDACRRLGQEIRITTTDARDSGVTLEHNHQAVTDLASDLTELSRQFQKVLNFVDKGKERQPTVEEELIEEISDDSMEQLGPREESMDLTNPFAGDVGLESSPIMSTTESSPGDKRKASQDLPVTRRQSKRSDMPSTSPTAQRVLNSPLRRRAPTAVLGASLTIRSSQSPMTGSPIETASQARPAIDLPRESSTGLSILRKPVPGQAQGPTATTGSSLTSMAPTTVAQQQSLVDRRSPAIDLTPEQQWYWDQFDIPGANDWSIDDSRAFLGFLQSKWGSKKQAIDLIEKASQYAAQGQGKDTCPLADSRSAGQHFSRTTNHACNFCLNSGQRGCWKIQYVTEDTERLIYRPTHYQQKVSRGQPPRRWLVSKRLP